MNVLRELYITKKSYMEYKKEKEWPPKSASKKCSMQNLIELQGSRTKKTQISEAVPIF